MISSAFWFQAIDSNATSMDISQVHIVFQRHAESSHNIRNPNAPDLSLTDLQSLVRVVANPTISPRRVNTGQYIPNGLTKFGMNSSREFVNLVGNNKLDKLSSPYYSQRARGPKS